jgi:hypothetical protein
MTNRITTAHLKLVAARINKKLNTPLEPYSTENGVSKSNAGNYHIDYAYGKVALRRMSKNGLGGSEDVLGGLYSKPELYKHMHAFLKGVCVSEQNC